MKPKIAIIIVNWNGWADTFRCMESVFKSSYPDYKVIVIDNGSTNDSVERIVQWSQNQEQAVESKASNLVLIESGENLGFAGGNNIGIRHALEEEADYVVLLNNDTTVPENFLESFLHTARQDQEVGILGCRVLQMDGSGRAQPGAQNRIPWLGFRAKDLKNRSGTVDVNFVTGSVMFIRSKVFRDIGLLNEKYFMYVEDIDFCYRAQKKGWKLIVDLDAFIYHRHHGSNTDKGFSVAYYSARNRLYLISRQLRGIKRITAIISFYLEQLLRVLRLIVRGHLNMIAGVFLGNMDFICGRTGPKAWP